MKYLLDTNICGYWLKGNEHIEQKVLSGGIDNIFVSFITVSELYYGAYKSERVDDGDEQYEAFQPYQRVET